jgi:hypothetical protein
VATGAPTKKYLMRSFVENDRSRLGKKDDTNSFAGVPGEPSPRGDQDFAHSGLGGVPSKYSARITPPGRHRAR